MHVGACILTTKHFGFQNKFKNELIFACGKQKTKIKTNKKKWLATACAFNEIEKSGTKATDMIRKTTTNNE